MVRASAKNHVNVVITRTLKTTLQFYKNYLQAKFHLKPEGVWLGATSNKVTINNR